MVNFNSKYKPIFQQLLMVLMVLMVFWFLNLTTKYTDCQVIVSMQDFFCIAAFRIQQFTWKYISLHYVTPSVPVLHAVCRIAAWY